MFLWKISPKPASAQIPSWIRAPPESFSPMQGAPFFIAISMTLQIFWAMVSESEPPDTVKSWANTYTSLPSMVPCPVTTPSPSNLVFSMPKFVQRCWTNMSYSSKLPSSRSIAILSLAVNFPLACWASILFWPPPIRALALRSTSSLIFSCWILIINIFYDINNILFCAFMLKSCKYRKHFWNFSAFGQVF